jgi:hypothetical protein
MTDIIHDQDLDKLLMCDQDDLLRYVFVVRELLVQLESEYHFLH